VATAAEGDAGAGEPAEAQGLEIPHAQLSAEALRGVITAFILREGTDYGERELPLEVKISQVLEQLQRGSARILYDPRSQSVDIVPVDPARP
jgi:uncharacterized protein